MFWGHLSDQGSFTPCPPDTELAEEIAYKTGLPVLRFGSSSLDDSSSRKIDNELPEKDVDYAAPIGACFCPEIRAFPGFWGEISSTASKVLKVTVKYFSDTKLAVNSR